jgi:hypothetical protein
MAMLGLQEFSSQYKEVRQILTALIPRMSAVDAQGCGNILYSMKLMTSEKSEVRKFLRALAPLIDSCDGNLNNQELANAYFGELTTRSNNTVLFLGKGHTALPLVAMLSDYALALATIYCG